MSKQTRPGDIFRRMTSFKDELERSMEFEVMANERRRSRFLSLVFSVLFTFFVAAALFFPQAARDFFGGDVNFPLVILVLFLYAAYEFGFQSVIGLFERRGLKFFAPPKYLNLFIEMSFPTLLLAFLLQYFDPVIALSLPPVFIYFLFLALSALRLEPVLSLVSGLVGGLEFMLLSMWAASTSTTHTVAENSSAATLVIPLSYISKAALIFGAGAITAYVAKQIRSRIASVFAVREEKNLIASIFGQHVSPSVVDKLISQKDEMTSELREVCIMFLDIRNFTAFSLNRSPAEVVAYLNTLFEPMIDIINGNKGLINKFLGDGFMAVFGAPLDDGEAVENALRSALQISDFLKKQVEDGLVAQTKIGVGLHAGAALTGTVGSSLKREYTIIGDVVNLASRIESLNKQFGSEILASEAVWRTVSAFPAKWPAPEALGPVSIKGIEAPVAIYRYR